MSEKNQLGIVQQIGSIIQATTNSVLPKYCSLQNNKNREFRCNKASQLKKKYESPECLMKLVNSGENIYAIKNMYNKEYFQSSINSMSSDVSSDKQLWKIKAFERVENGYTIQNLNNKKYMTNHAGKLHSGEPGEGEIWIIEERANVVQEDLASSYYGSLQNEKNKEYRTSRETHLSSNMEIPKCLFKMIKLSNGNYGIQSQESYEFFQSSIGTMVSSINSEKQQWKIELVNETQDKIFTIQNIKNKEYMTAHASQLHSGKPGLEEDWKIRKYTYRETSSWMSDNWDLLSNKRLDKICMPGSHDSGTYNPTSLTAFGWVGNTKTQIFDIQMQLMQGIRFFDLRPTLHKGEFYTFHASNVAGKLQGAIGENMEQIFAQIRAYANKKENKKELIILDFSHAMRWSNLGYENELTELQKQQFIELVKSELGDLLICRKATQLSELTYNDLITDGPSNVLCLFNNSNFGTSAGDTEKGIWNKKYFKTKGGYSDTNNLQEMISTKTDEKHPSQIIQLKNSNRRLPENNNSFMFELCWQLTLNDLQSTLDSPTILDLAYKANAALYPTITEWIDEQIINKNVYPNIINTDACSESSTQAVKLSIEITKHINS